MRPNRWMSLRHCALAVLTVLAAVCTLIAGRVSPAAAMVQPFVGVTPQRLLETRVGPGLTTIDGQQQGTGAFGAAETRHVPVLGRGTIPASGVAAVAINVTAINPSSTAFITVFPKGAAQPTASNLNTAAGRTLPNMVVVPLGADGAISIFNSAGTVNLAVDVLGWFPTGSGFTGATPQRLLDTRASGTTIDGQQQAGGVFTDGETRDLPVLGRGSVPSTGVGAVAVNVTAINPSATGFLTVFPTGSTRPTASNLNTAAGRTLPNMVIVPVGADGKISIFHSGGTTQLAVDILDWFPSGTAFIGVNPQRLLDTRASGTTIDGQQQAGGAFTGGETRDLPVVGRGSIPATGVGAVAVNVTAINPSAGGFLTVFPAGATRPTASNLNTSAGQTVPNMVIVPVGSGGKISIFNSGGSTNLAVDILGWFPAPVAGTTSVVSRALNDRGHGGNPTESVISRNGNKVAFTSLAQNLVVGDTNLVDDVFVVDIATGVIERVSVADDESQLPVASSRPRISDDGRYVVFVTAAAAVTGDTNGFNDVYRRDLQTGTTVRVSIAPDGSQMTSGLNSEVSGDGNVVAFQGLLSNTNSIYVRDIAAGTTVNASDGAFVPSGYGAGAAGPPAISQDGNKIALAKVFFNSTTVRIFRFDRSAVTLTQMSPPPQIAGHPEGGSSPAMSDDGSAITYERDGHLFWAKVGAAEQAIDVSTAGVTADRTNGHARFAGATYDVIFESDGTNLVTGDTNGTRDVFLRTTGATRTTTRLSVRIKAGFTTQANSISFSATMSSDGSRVAWISRATNLAPETDNSMANVMLKEGEGGPYRTLDRAGFTTVAHGVSDKARMSPDGRYVVFESDAADIENNQFGNTADTYMLDRVTNAISPVGVRINGVGIFEGSNSADVSDNGRRLLFHSAGNVYGNTPGFMFAYVRDLDANTVTLVSGPSAVNGGDASVLQSAISGNGRFVVFSSGATNVVGGDTNGTIDVFVHDLQTGSVERVSLSSTGAQITGSSNTVLSPSISADGRFVAWATNATNVVPGATTAVSRVYVRDRQLGTTTLVDVAPTGTITDDGKSVVMTSFNALLPADVNGVADAYVKTLATGTLELISADSAETPANAASSNASISADGRFVTFTSAATNLVGTDTNGTLDLFLRDRLLGTTVRLSVDAAGGQVSSSPFSSAISADGRVIAFTDSLPLIPGDLNATFDIYLRDTGVIAP